ncbi:MAG: hypothetical protein ACRELA_13470 [Candidatus Rokuibacteriota bacterium]
MEDAALLSSPEGTVEACGGTSPRRGWRPRSGARRVISSAFLLVLASSGPVDGLAATEPSDPGQALVLLGPPGLLWGRLAVEGESPDGTWTPLPGVEVTVYPYVPALEAELERIRESARDSGRQYETAVARLQAALRAFRAQVDPTRGRADPPPPSSGASTATPSSAPGGEPDDVGPVRRRLTDPRGVFVFDALPSGHWLVVALRVAPYAESRSRQDVGSGRRTPDSRFTARPSGSPAREAEVWVTRVRLAPGERTRLLWTDRARFMVGPLR